MQNSISLTINWEKGRTNTSFSLGNEDNLSLSISILLNWLFSIKSNVFFPLIFFIKSLATFISFEEDQKHGLYILTPGFNFFINSSLK